MKINIEEIQKLTAADGLLPYAAVCCFRGQALFPIQKTAWKAGETELICLHGGLRLCHIGRMAKNIFETVITRKSPFISLTKLYARFCRYIRYTHIRQVMKCSQ